LADHLERLAWSAERTGIRLPLPVGELAREVERLLDEARTNGLDGELSIRIMITRGEAPLGLDPTAASNPRRIAFIQPLRPPAPEAYRDGVSVITFSAYRPSESAAGAKVGNYLESILAIQEARQTGAHEALIVDGAGRVLEGTTSNLFVLRGQKLVTPPASLPILPGITRKLVMEAARDVGLEVEEAALTVDDVQSADEVFLTSTIREVLPVVRVDSAVIGAGVPGPHTRAIHAAFRARS
jgi:branched-chain amino acid aminotransferase